MGSYLSTSPHLKPPAGLNPTRWRLPCVLPDANVWAFILFHYERRSGSGGFWFSRTNNAARSILSSGMGLRSLKLPLTETFNGAALDWTLGGPNNTALVGSR